MERQNDSELHELLREWKVDDAPGSLESRVMASRRDSWSAWWHVLIHGYIRIPVPVACGLVILIMFGAWHLNAHVSNVCRAESFAPAAIAGVSPEVAKPAARLTCIFNSSC